MGRYETPETRSGAHGCSVDSRVEAGGAETSPDGTVGHPAPKAWQNPADCGSPPAKPFDPNALHGLRVPG